MFTGIIEDLGTVRKISKTQITVKTKLDDIKIGDSICVSGVCLTVNNFTISRFHDFTADISEETFKKTNLGELKIGSIINLERALKSNGRLGGHFVTGHIDGTGKILKIKKSGNSEIWQFSIPENLSKYIAEKGSVAIDGISLTIALIGKKSDSFSAAIIPHTLKNTALKEKKIGDTVNLETDILAKYILKQNNEETKITSVTLKKAGFYD
ncbi:MAG: riboflavin synthase [Elusimicrobiota bacterium]|nr:riboflavin synthase [Elusimicrobiota bacterium]